MRPCLLPVLLLLLAPGTPARASAPSATDAQLRADTWVRREQRPDALLLDARAVAAHNARLQRLDPSFNALERLPTTLARAQVRGWIERLSRLPPGPLYDGSGAALPGAQRDALLAALALDAVPAARPLRYGLVTRRADLRTFPTRARVLGAPDDPDIDLFQESALFPGTPVALLHESRDGAWWFVVSPLYAAWVEREAIAEGPAAQVLGYGRKEPALVVTGASVRTAFTPEQPALSELQLEMGVRVPLLPDWPPHQPVNGQHPAAGHVIELPLRAPDGALRLVPALLPRAADVSRGPLPLTRGNLLRQGFKFLGERYGWGHGFNARDCSGFVSEVYRSFGVQLPRNTRDQAQSPAFGPPVLDAGASRAERLAALRTLQVGDLVYLPGHVMMVIGHQGGTPYVIHDAQSVTYRDAAGALNRLYLNGVSVTPLAPLLSLEGEPLVERITRIHRLRTGRFPPEPTP